MKRVLPLLLFLSTLGLACADELQDQAAALKKSIQEQSESLSSQTTTTSVKSNDKLHPSPPEDPAERQKRFADQRRVMEQIQQLQLLQSALETVLRMQNSFSDEGLEQVRQQISDLNAIDPRLRAQALAFLDKFKELQHKRAAAYQAQVDEILKRAHAVADTATDPDALDSVMAEMDAVSHAQWNTSSLTGRNTQSKLSAAVRALTNWQSYLRNLQAGYDSTALNSLQQILNQSSSYPFFTADRVRQEISKLKNKADSPMKEVSEILASVKQASDIPAAADRLSKIPRSSQQDQWPITSTVQRMQTLAKTYSASVYGATDFSSSFYIDSTSDSAPEFQRIENLLRLYLFTHAFANLGVPAPAADENASAYLTRLVTDAAREKNWTLVQQLLELSHFPFLKIAGGTSQENLNAVTMLLSAQRLEAAAQYAAAIRTYRAVILSPGNLIPVDEVVAHLRQLTDEHKDALAQIDREENIRDAVSAYMQQQAKAQQEEMIRRMQMMNGVPPNMPPGVPPGAPSK